MAIFGRKHRKIQGQSPGSLVFVGSRKVETVDMRVIDYEPASVTDQPLADIRDGMRFKDSDSVSWVNVNGLHNETLIGDIGKVFGIHPLVLEDILNTGQRPKLDEFDDYNFVVLKMVRFDRDENCILTEQLSMVFGKNVLLTFQEQPGDVFEPVWERIRWERSRLRTAGTDYLAYALMDTIVDHYISTIEMIGERIEDLEEDIFAGEDQAVMEKIHRYKRDILHIGRGIRPAKEAISKLARLDNGLVCDATLLFVKDLQDHVNQACEAVETYRDLLTDQLNLYNSVLANKMNDVMKILTIFAAVFIPLTFIAGIYGTNFEYLPELKYKYSYFIFWTVLVVTAGCLLYYFKRKRWF